MGVNNMVQMSDSEKEIMQIIWSNGGSIFISDLLNILEKNNKSWKRTTVSTFIKRLIDKEFIKTKKFGNMNKYIAVISENEYLSKQAKSFVNNVFGGSVKNLLSSLYGQEEIASKDIKELQDFWDKGKEKME